MNKSEKADLKRQIAWKVEALQECDKRQKLLEEIFGTSCYSCRFRITAYNGADVCKWKELGYTITNIFERTPICPFLKFESPNSPFSERKNESRTSETI